MGDAPGLAESEGNASDLADRAATLWPSAAIPGALHIVSTPIGNLGDISLRALAVLKEAAVICCEDTRHARTLLSRYGIGTPTIAVHEHNEASVIPRLVARLKAGDALALISDAGTPLVSDPGARLAEAAATAGPPWAATGAAVPRPAHTSSTKIHGRSRLGKGMAQDVATRQV